MEALRLADILDKHCRFVLKSGKEVFGVLWKNELHETKGYCFGSKQEHNRYKRSLRTTHLQEGMPGLFVDPNLFISAELLG